MDLIGLPPTLAETDEAFLADNSPQAWERLIDKLLASPHYGERWGRHWLDVARYADSNGFEHDFDRPNAWRYRDYVIRAFNQDIPYNDFLVQQIAGDEMPGATDDSRIATGFLRCFAKVGHREKDNPEFRYEYLDDMIATIGRGVLGLTVNCARCHNHKFDPIPQKDYYSMQASLFGYVETDYPLAPKAEAEAYRKKMEEIDARVAAAQEADRRNRSSPTNRSCCKEIQGVPGERAAGHCDAGREAHAGPGAARQPGDPHHGGFRREDRPSHDGRGSGGQEDA